MNCVFDVTAEIPLKRFVLALQHEVTRKNRKFWFSYIPFQTLLLLVFNCIVSKLDFKNIHFVVLFCSFEVRILTSLDFYVVKTIKWKFVQKNEKLVSKKRPTWVLKMTRSPQLLWALQRWPELSWSPWLKLVIHSAQCCHVQLSPTEGQKTKKNFIGHKFSREKPQWLIVTSIKLNCRGRNCSFDKRNFQILVHLIRIKHNRQKAINWLELIDSVVK